MAYEIVWTNRSLQQLRKLYEYIAKDSPQNAVKFVDKIVSLMEKARPNPEFYGPDKYKINNDGSYRAFEIYSYRVAYRIVKNEFRVLRVRHTKQGPLLY